MRQLLDLPLNLLLVVAELVLPLEALGVIELLVHGIGDPAHNAVTAAQQQVLRGALGDVEAP